MSHKLSPECFAPTLNRAVLTAVGGVITGLGYILSSFASDISTLVFTYGVIAGAGVGIAYGVPLAVAARWFPDKKGLAVGLTVIGFGLSPLVTAPIAKSLIETYQVAKSFLILGIAFTIIILLISATLSFPPREWKPAGWESSQSVRMATNDDVQMLQTSSFYGLWICYTIGTFVGLSAIGISSPVAQEIIKLDAGTAAATVSLFAVFNGLGRPLFGWLADKFDTLPVSYAVPGDSCFLETRFLVELLVSLTDSPQA